MSVTQQICLVEIVIVCVSSVRDVILTLKYPLTECLLLFLLYLASNPDAVHVVLDRHLVTGQNENSTLPAVQNLLMLCNVR